MGFFDGNDFVGVAVKDQDGTGDLLYGFGNVKPFQIMKQGQVDALAVVVREASDAPLVSLRRRQDAARESFGMDRGGDGHQGGETCLLSREKQRHRAAHAGAQDGGLTGVAALNQRVGRLEILHLAAVGDVFELAARLTDVAKVEAQHHGSPLSQRPAEKDELVAILFRLHALAKNYRTPRRSLRRMVENAGKGVAAGIGERYTLLVHECKSTTSTVR